MHARLVAATLGALALQVAAGAQTIVVDAAGGPGAQFVDIAPAVAAAPEGATLLVRPGDYSAFVIDGKSLTILCEPFARAYDWNYCYVEVRNLAPHQQVTMRGLRIGSLLGAAILCSDCQGTVLLDGCRSDYSTSQSGGGLSVSYCDDVRLNDCVFFHQYATACYCIESSLTGVDGSFAALFPNAGLYGSQSTIQLADYQVGNGGFYEAVNLDQSELRVLGDGWLTTTALGGIGGGGPTIDGTGHVRISPSVVVDPGTSAPFGAGIQVQFLEMPSLDADTDAAGGAATAVLDGPTNGIAVLYLALPGLPTTPFANLDPLCIAAGTESLQAAGTLATPLQAGYAVPPLPLLLGTRVAWQAASLDPGNGLQISNAATYVHY